MGSTCSSVLCAADSVPEPVVERPLRKAKTGPIVLHDSMLRTLWYWVWLDSPRKFCDQFGVDLNDFCRWLRDPSSIVMPARRRVAMADATLRFLQSPDNVKLINDISEELAEVIQNSPPLGRDWFVKQTNTLSQTGYELVPITTAEPRVKLPSESTPSSASIHEEEEGAATAQSLPFAVAPSSWCDPDFEKRIKRLKYQYAYLSHEAYCLLWDYCESFNDISLDDLPALNKQFKSDDDMPFECRLLLKVLVRYAQRGYIKASDLFEVHPRRARHLNLALLPRVAREDADDVGTKVGKGFALGRPIHVLVENSLAFADSV